MDKSSVRNELFAQAMEVGEFEVFPTPSEAGEDQDNSFLVSTGSLFGVPKVFIVRVEEFHHSQEEGDEETEKILQQQERHIKRVLSEHQIVLRGSVNRRVANVTTVGPEAIQSFGELSGKKSSQPIDGSS